MAWGQAIANSFGRAGNEFATATDANVDRALKIIQAKLLQAEIQGRLQEQQLRMKQMQVPKNILLNTPGGGTNVVQENPMTGAIGSPQTLVPGQPVIKPLKQQYDEAVTNGDYTKASTILDQMKKEAEATRAPKADTPYSDFKKGGEDAKKAEAWESKIHPKKATGTSDSSGNSVADSWVKKYESGEVKMAQVPKEFKNYVASHAGKPKDAKQSATQQNAATGLKVLEVSLFGDKTSQNPDEQRGLIDTLGVLDSTISRIKIMPYISDPTGHFAVTNAVLAMASGALSKDEFDYITQMNRAIGAINALRSVTGLPRSTQQLMERYVRELADPISVSSAERGRSRLAAIQREINAAMKTLGPGVSGETSNTPPPGAKIISASDL